MTRRAFSYARFSTSEQKDGRSLKRQEEAAKAYCARHGLTLDERSFADQGVSGYHGANATHGELGVFLDMVNEGRIPKGSVLLVENIDRLSRLPPDEANAIIMELVKAGVEVVTTSPEQRYTLENIRQIGTWIPLQVAQCLASEESRKKGERVADAWADKRGTAGTIKLTKRGPAWLKLTADRKGWVVIEEKAAWIRRIFALAIEGCGAAKIAGELHRDCSQGLTGKGWQPGFIHDLLRSRSVLGEYQPHVGTCAKRGCKATRRPAGDPVKGYFPAIVSEADFYRAQAALDRRRRGGGRVTGTPNLFNGLLTDARDGCRMTVNYSFGKKVLVSSGAIRKRAGSRFTGFPYPVFEEAILSLLAELKPSDILGKQGAAEDHVALLSGRLTAVNRKLDTVRTRAATEDDVAVFLDLLADLDRQRSDLAVALEQAKTEAASQAGDNLGEFASLVELLADADPEEREALRRKVQAALRRIVKEMHALIVPRGVDRFAAVQVFFADGKKHRDYLIRLRGGRPLPARSLADAVASGLLDLRKPAHAARLERLLTTFDLDRLTAE